MTEPTREEWEAARSFYDSYARVAAKMPPTRTGPFYALAVLAIERQIKAPNEKEPPTPI